jgi:DNA-binding NtrC family response regulator
MARIFVIDDEPMLRDLVSTLLRLDGHEVTVMADAVAAYDAIIAAQPPIDLLLTDPDVKPVSGVELVNRLRKGHIACPVVFMSGKHGMAGVITESLGQGAVIEKPFTSKQLRSTVKKSLTAARKNTIRVNKSRSGC